MRFKVVFNEEHDSLVVNCLPGGDSVLLPDCPNHHVLFPIPMDLLSDIRSDLNRLIDPSENEAFLDINKAIQDLQNKRRALLTNVRERLNPVIIDQCKCFEKNHPEFFI